MSFLLIESTKASNSEFAEKPDCHMILGNVTKGRTHISMDNEDFKEVILLLLYLPCCSELVLIFSDWCSCKFKLTFILCHHYHFIVCHEMLG